MQERQRQAGACLTSMATWGLCTADGPSKGEAAHPAAASRLIPSCKPALQLFHSLTTSQLQAGCTANKKSCVELSVEGLSATHPSPLPLPLHYSVLQRPGLRLESQMQDDA